MLRVGPGRRRQFQRFDLPDGRVDGGGFLDLLRFPAAINSSKRRAWTSMRDWNEPTPRL